MYREKLPPAAATSNVIHWKRKGCRREEGYPLLHKLRNSYDNRDLQIKN